MKPECIKLQKQIPSFIDGELNDKDTAHFISHVKSCSKCFEELETNYIIQYALEYMDTDKDLSYNMNEMVRSLIRKREQELHTRTILEHSMRICILVAEAIIAVTTMFRFLPWTIPQIAKDFIRMIVEFVR